MRVLFVDDDERILRSAIRLAERKGHRASSCEIKNRGDAETLINDGDETSTFGLIVLDVEMPGVNGFDLAQRLRSETAFSGKIVVWTTSSDTGYRTRAEDLVRSGVINGFYGKLEELRTLSFLAD